MWMLLMVVCLLDQDQAAPLPWERSSLQPVLQQQLDQTVPSAVPDVGQQKTSSSSSSSSSSSVSSESSQSSEGPQQLRERQTLENTAGEQMDSSQEAPANSSRLWLDELVLLGGRAGEREAERDTGDDSAASRESRPQALLTFHLLNRPRGLRLTADQAATGEGGGALTGVGGAAGEGGGVRGEEMDAELPQLDDSRADGLAHHAGYHGNEAGLELGL